MDETFRVMDDFFHAADSIFTSIGLYYFSKNNWDSKLKFFHQIFNTIISLCISIFTICFVIFCTQDIVLWIEGLCIWITAVIMQISVIEALIFRQKFRIFLEEMAFKDMILDMPFVEYVMKISYEDGKLKELRDLIISTQCNLFKYSNFFVKFYATATTSTGIVYLADSLFKMIFREDDSLRILAFPMWFPWKLDDWKIYIPTFIFHAYAGIFTSLVFPCFQTTIVLLVGQIIRQLRILTFILLHLDDLMTELVKERRDRWQECCTSVFNQCISYYVKVKNNRLNFVCRPFYLALILDCIFLVCVCSVKIAMAESLSPELIKYCMQGVIFTMMVGGFCFLGQQVQNECEELEYAVTEKWYIYDKAHRKNVLIFSMAVSQQMPINIFGSIPLSLQTFSWFIKTGMSFFTLAMSVLEE